MDELQLELENSLLMLSIAYSLVKAYFALLIIVLNSRPKSLLSSEELQECASNSIFQSKTIVGMILECCRAKEAESKKNSVTGECENRITGYPMGSALPSITEKSLHRKRERCHFEREIHRFSKKVQTAMAAAKAQYRNSESNEESNSRGVEQTTSSADSIAVNHMLERHFFYFKMAKSCGCMRCTRVCIKRTKYVIKKWWKSDVEEINIKANAHDSKAGIHKNGSAAGVEGPVGGGVESAAEGAAPNSIASSLSTLNESTETSPSTAVSGAERETILYYKLSVKLKVDNKDSFMKAKDTLFKEYINRNSYRKDLDDITCSTLCIIIRHTCERILEILE